MKKIISIVMVDPARTSDPTGIVGITGNLQTGKIHVKYAREITDKDPIIRIQKTATILNWINEKINPYFLGCETNNNGTEIIAKIQRYGIDIQGIATSANLTKTTREKGATMDKPWTIKYLAQMKEDGTILFPEVAYGAMKKLITQISEIVGIRQPSGHISYKAIRGRHDDLVLALLLCVHVFLVYQRKWMEQ